MRGHAANATTDDPLSIIQYIDMKTYLPGDILTKVDRASMAHALEVRVPLLDHKFVEWVSGLPSTVKLKGGEGKDIFIKVGVAFKRRNAEGVSILLDALPLGIKLAVLPPERH